jgi:hypothetical protein
MSRIAVLTIISRSFSASLALLFTAVSAFAQVTIRERVEIHPRKDSAIAGPQQASSSAISPGTIRFDFSFGGSLLSLDGRTTSFWQEMLVSVEG